MIKDERGKIAKGNIPWNKGIKMPADWIHPMKGKKHNTDTLSKMRLAKLGKPSNWKGKHPTEESRLKMRLARLGKKQTEHQKEMTRQRMIGNTWGFQKGSHINKGVKKTKEQIEKMSKENSYNWKGGKDASTKRKYAPRPKPEQCETCGAIGDICYDHDHTTGLFRGWICRRCNFALGLVKDNKEILQALIDYLNN